MTDLSNSGPIDRWENSSHPERRCTAHRKNGDQCKNAARMGTNVCDFHGAKAPQVKRKARERLEEASDRLARELLKMATNPEISESVRLSAIKDALDRGGVSAKTAVEVEVGPLKPWEQILDGMTVLEGGSREAFRRSQAKLESNASTGALEGQPHNIQSPIEAQISDGLPQMAAVGSARGRTIRRLET